MDGIRLNFSHGTHADHEASARRARAVQAEIGRPLALIADLQGPKIRIGDLEAPAELEAGDSIVVAGADACGSGDLPVAPDVLGVGARGGRRDPHRRRPRPPPRRADRRRACALRGRHGRHRRAAQGRQRPRRPAPGSVADRQGSRGSRLRALAGRRLRRAVVRAHASGRRSAQVADRGCGLAGVGDREDRAEGGGGRSSRRSSTSPTR